MTEPQIDGELSVRICFSCRMKIHDDCECMVLDGADPEDVGYPPYHDGCRCFVVITTDREPARVLGE